MSDDAHGAAATGAVRTAGLVTGKGSAGTDVEVVLGGEYAPMVVAQASRTCT